MSDRQRFLNKVVIVTGAAHGIGRGVALQVASEGAQVVLADYSDFVEETLAEIEAENGDAIIVKANLETYAGAAEVAAKAIENYGRIDVLINNVGGAIWMKPFTEFSPEEIDIAPSSIENEHEDFVKAIGKKDERLIILLSTEKILDIKDELEENN